MPACGTKVVWLATWAWMGALAACTYSPTYGGVRCSADGSCPDGYRCSDGECVARADEEPPDGGDPGADPGSATDGSDPADQDDAGFDATDETGDPGADPGADPGSDPGASDMGPCGHACPSSQYCDEIAGQCAPCTNEEHCGASCGACEAGTTCLNVSGTFFCLPVCTAANTCEELPCGLSSCVCSVASFGPDTHTDTYAWHLVTDAPPHRCRVNDGIEPLPETRCHDERFLLFNCPIDGVCQTGSCVADITTERTHDCGPEFGCQGDINSGVCRTYRKSGQACKYNFDCQSFCCDRIELSACIQLEPGRCKYVQSYYREGITQYIWTAWADPDPHDIQAWSWSHGVPDDVCAHDWECDSGRCGGYLLDDKCALPDCLSNTEAVTIKAQYFCGDGNHDAHISSVINHAPFPEPDRCE